MGKVFKVCEEDDWESTKNEDFFLGSKTDRSDGFIHFSTSEQLEETLYPLFYFRTTGGNLRKIFQVEKSFIFAGSKNRGCRIGLGDK